MTLLEKRSLFILAGFLAGTSIGLYVFYPLVGQFSSLLISSVLVLCSGIFGILLLGSFFVISQWINKKLALEKKFSTRIALDLIINICVAIFSSSIAHYTLLKVVLGSTLTQIWEAYKESFLTLWILMVVLVLIYNVSMVILYAYSHYAEGQIADVKMERKQLKLQFEALKNQLSPHFLFNSLNTISSLIHTDENRAEEFIRRLADTYQYVLGTHQQKLIPLEKELEFVNAYYFLLQVRFQEGLNLKVDVPSQLLTHQIPPLTVQILIENAIKHNVFSKEQPLNITVEVAANSLLKVVNNKTIAPLAVKSNYVGLKNIQKRYSYFTKHKVKIVNNNNFEVHFPIIKKVA
ncbi:MAG: histidine kinase [Cyclobacteriaceae bacterium]|nr:histidine kinase [Cyclobacteriaceae bacterium]